MIELINKKSNVNLTTPVIVAGGTTADLSNYYNKDEINELIADFATNDDVAQAVSDKITNDDLSKATANLATTEYVDNAVNSLDIPDVSGYALKSEIPTLEGYAKTEDIPDVSAFQTEEQVLALIKEHGGGTLPASEEAEF